MNVAMRQRLVEVAKASRTCEVITFLYRDHPQGASFEGLKEMLFLHDAFEESQLTQLVEHDIVTFDGTRYTLSAEARQMLDRDATILMDE